MSNDPAIFASHLSKRFGNTIALRDLNLSARQGTVLGVLGPNGAGKTTAVRILTTLTTPDGGNAFVNGVNVAKDPMNVKRSIGLTGQSASLDEHLTAFENLDMFGRLYHLSRAQSKARANSLLEQFGLSDVANRPAKTFSGGMRRRLDLAAGLICEPPVIFLDEPTTGLDPRSRIQMWDVIRSLVSGGSTLLLTTQYLEEADSLADNIVVVDKGTDIATGTPEELKRQVGGERIEMTVEESSDIKASAEILSRFGIGAPDINHALGSVRIAVSNKRGLLTSVATALDDARISVVDFGLRRPTLDEVFLTLTGKTADSQDDDASTNNHVPNNQTDRSTTTSDTKVTS